MSLTHLSLFSGVGGLDLAAEWAGIQTIGQCEWAEYPAKVLEKHWPDVPRWKDIRELTYKSFMQKVYGMEVVPSESMPRTNITVLSGGFP